VHVLAAVLLCSTALFGADLTGSWKGTAEWNQNGEDRKSPVYLVLQQEGATVTGKAGPAETDLRPVNNGKVSGNEFTFNAEADEGTVYFTLKIDGDRLHGTGIIEDTVIALTATRAAAATSEKTMLVSTAWLTEHLKDTALVILHVGAEEDYKAGHIPGARLVTLADIAIPVTVNGLRLELPSDGTLTEALAKLGITDNSRVVVYAGANNPQSATRVWFTLDYAGLGGQAALLDGGLGKWRAESRATTQEPAHAVEPGKLTLRTNPNIVADAEWIRANRSAAGVKLIDARLPQYYSGADPGMMSRSGRIPGAVNVPYTSVFAADGTLKSPEELKTILQAEGKEVASYCHLGQQATVIYFVARSLGYKAKMYDGSFQDWSERSDLPVDKDQ
jgi:thiosulfate/3-mercaptopyruvate sulfurtransferase